jgi:hypothetical protein
VTKTSKIRREFSLFVVVVVVVIIDDIDFVVAAILNDVHVAIDTSAVVVFTVQFRMTSHKRLYTQYNDKEIFRKFYHL